MTPMMLTLLYTDKLLLHLVTSRRHETLGSYRGHEKNHLNHRTAAQNSSLAAGSIMQRQVIALYSYPPSYDAIQVIKS